MPVLGTSAASSGGVNGNPNFRNLQPLGDHADVGGAIGNFTPPALTGTYLVRHKISKATPTIAFVYSNVLNTNPVTIKAGVRSEVFGYTPMLFNGAASIIIPAGGQVMTDPAPCAVEAGGFIQSLTYFTISAAQTLRGSALLARYYSLEGFSTADQIATGTVTGVTYDYSAVNAYGPSLVLGYTGTRQVIVGAVGDSISQGTGDSTSMGFLERAGSGVYPFVREGWGGEGTFSTVDSGSGTGVSIRFQRLAGSTHILCASGRNNLSGTPTATFIAASLLAMWRVLRTLNAPVYQTTMTPASSSTDAWATVANQTVETNQAQRIAVNDWLRAGAKVDGTGAPLFDGTGTASVYLTGVVEMADVVESARNSGKWKAGGMTTDGVHPTTAMHITMAATVAAWQSTLIA